MDESAQVIVVDVVFDSLPTFPREYHRIPMQCARYIQWIISELSEGKGH